MDFLPEIDADLGDLAKMTENAIAAIEVANDPPSVFLYGGIPARVEKDHEGVPAIRPLNLDRMRHQLARVARWTRRRTQRTGNAVKSLTEPAAPPIDVVRDLLATPELPFPALSRIVEVPTFAPNGSLRLTPGYHAESRVLYAPAAGLRIPPLPDGPPSPDEIARARAILCEELLGDFPFVGEPERANAIALLLLPFVRDMIDGHTPLHLIEKPTAGTGAGLLMDVFSLISSGREPALMTEGRDEDEWRKRITAKLSTSPAIIVIDNVKRRLEAAALSAAITAKVWEDRLMGVTKMARLPVRCVWVTAGNNPAVSDEIARRTIRIRMDAKTERPWQRIGFRHPDLRAWVREERGALVWALLIPVLAWIDAGQPRGEKKLGSFEDWSTTMSGLLEAAGVPGFLDNAEDFYEASDAEGTAWRTLVAAWHEKHGENKVTSAELSKLVMDDGASIALDLGKGSERSQRTTFGMLLGRQRDRQYGEFRIIDAGKKKGAAMFRLVRVG
jgi:hypothetical protein